jgi:uncharacterized protein YbaR (Trm112 family)
MENQVISKELLNVLACPACKNAITLAKYHKEANGLECQTCNCIYPIKNGIPVMLIDEAIRDY